MSNTTKLLAVLGVAFAAGVGTAQAQATRTWVSGVGDDANPCSRTAPCKTFPGAISKTAAFGEINCIDPGGFGAVTITKSITIDCGGVFGSIISAGTPNAVNVNTAGIKVVLRNFEINGLNTGTNGINVISGAQVLIENVQITGLLGNGVNTSSLASTTNVQVKNVSFNYIVGSCVSMATTAGFAIGQVTGSTFQNCGTGVSAGNNGFVTVESSKFLQNTNGAATTGTGKLNVENSLFTNNSNGVTAAVGTTVNVSNNGLYDNTNGFVINGTMLSDGKNRVVGASANPSVTLPLR